MSTFVNARREIVHAAELVEPPPQAEEPEVPQTTGTRELACDLSDQEVIERAKALAAMLADLSMLEEQRRAASKHFGEDIKGLEREVQKLGQAIRTRQELRDVACIERQNFSLNEVVVVRTDTSAVVESRAMTPEERQASLFPETRDDAI